jgi:hypothetical protein
MESTVSDEDEQGAEQATNACNHVFYKQNNGFLILYTAIKDGLTSLDKRLAVVETILEERRR